MDSKLQRIIQSTNELLQVAPENLGPKDVQRILKDACRALEDVVDGFQKDGFIASAFRLVQNRSAKLDEQMRALITTDQFVDVFLVEETKTFLAKGMSSEAIGKLIGEAIQLRARLLDTVVTPESCLPAVRQLQGSICGASAGMAKASSLQEAAVRNTWVRAGFVIGGAAVVALNAPLLAAVGTAPVGAVSTLFGGGLFTKGW